MQLQWQCHQGIRVMMAIPGYMHACIWEVFPTSHRALHTLVLVLAPALRTCMQAAPMPTCTVPQKYNSALARVSAFVDEVLLPLQTQRQINYQTAGVLSLTGSADAGRPRHSFPPGSDELWPRCGRTGVAVPAPRDSLGCTYASHGHTSQ